MLLVQSALPAAVMVPHWRSSVNWAHSPPEEEVLVVAADVEGDHVGGLGVSSAGRDQAGAVDADLRTILEVDGLRAAAGGVAAVEDMRDAHADRQVGAAFRPDAVGETAKQLALFVAAIAMTEGLVDLAPVR